MSTETASASSSTQSLTGCVKWFNNGLNYGFITVLSDGEHRNTDVFVHQSNIRTARDCFRTLYTGECVQFDLAKSDNEKHPVHAVNVHGFNGVQLRCEVPRGSGFRSVGSNNSGNGRGNGRGGNGRGGNGRGGNGRVRSGPFRNGNGNGNNNQQKYSDDSSAPTQENGAVVETTTVNATESAAQSIVEPTVSNTETVASAPLDNATAPTSVGKGRGKGRGRKVSA